MRVSPAPMAASFSIGGATEAETEDNKVGVLETILKTYDFNSVPGRTPKIVNVHSPDFFKSEKEIQKLGKLRQLRLQPHLDTC